MLAFPLNLSYDTSSISQIGYVSIVRSLQHFIEQTSFHSLFELTQTNEYTKVHNMLYMSLIEDLLIMYFGTVDDQTEFT